MGGDSSKPATSRSTAAEEITRRSLGEFHHLGDLYNARNHTFCQRSIFSKEVPEGSTTILDDYQIKTRCTSTDSISERFELLNVEPELQLLVLLEQTQMSGSWLYLAEEKKSEKTLSSSLLYQITTKSEKLQTFYTKYSQLLDEEVLKIEEYTHVVFQINWGANIILNLKCSNSPKEKAEGKLKNLLKTLQTCLKPQNNDKPFDESLNDLSEDVSVQCFTDILDTDGNIPSTVESAFELVSKSGKILEKINEGKGKPLSYVLVPIPKIKGRKCDVIKATPNNFVLDVVHFFEDVSVIKQKLTDAMTSFQKYEKYFPDEFFKKIKKTQRDIEINEAKFKNEIIENLPKFKNDAMDLETLVKKIEKVQESDLNLKKIEEEFANAYKYGKEKIGIVEKCIENGIRYLEKDANFYNVSLNFKSKVFFISENLRAEHPAEVNIILEELLSEAKINLTDDNKFLIVDVDIHPKLNKDLVGNTPKIVDFRQVMFQA